MLRALLVNGAVDTSCGGPIPNTLQGWGRLHLGDLVAPARQRAYVDQTLWLTAAGETHHWHIAVADVQRPLKITLAWTDPPGALGSGTAQVPALVNRLALRLRVGAQLYRGNHFANGWSTSTADTSEATDNMQNVFLPAGVATGTLRLSVTALALTMNALTGAADIPQQDFALFIANGVPIHSARTGHATLVSLHS
jgi:hypothetical protein